MVASCDRVLGLGLLCDPALPELLRGCIDEVDYVSIIPEQLDDRDGERLLDWLAARRPLVAHDLGLALGSPRPIDRGALDRLGQLQARYGFRWHSDHLALVGVDGLDAAAHAAGAALPLPRDREVLQRCAVRARELAGVLGVPLLVENCPAIVEYPEQDYDENEFLDRLCDAGRCGLVLDLGALVDADARPRIAALAGWIVEVHVSGAGEHGGRCSDAVLELVAEVIARAPRLRGVTYELTASCHAALGDRGVREELARLRGICSRRTSEGPWD